MLVSAEVVLDGRRVRYTLRRSPRARWISCWIRPETGLVVTVPSGGAPEHAEAFLKRHRRWVFRELARLERQFATLPHAWPYGAKLLYRGQAHQVVLQHGRPGRVDYRSDERQLVVTAPSAGIAGARQVLQRWLKQEAAAVLNERVKAVGQRMGLQANRIYVRNLRCRWGSCWPGGSLSFNYRLVMAPPRILEYVVVHELAHLRQPNHSPAFWAIVGEHLEDHRQARAWLRAFGPCLTI